jgi:hypothetical protein
VGTPRIGTIAVFEDGPDVIKAAVYIVNADLTVLQTD